MPYIGNTVQNQGFAPAIDYFNGNGVTVTFTLSRPLASVAQIICAIDNVIQNPSSSFTVSGNSITFTSAPLSGTNNIWVEYTSLITTYAAISQDPSVIGDITASGGYLATGDFGNSYIDGVIVDYVTGAARLTTGPLDDMVFYHGGSSARSEMMKLSYAGNSTLTGALTTTGNIGVGVTPTSKLNTYATGVGYGQFNNGNTAEDGIYPLVGSYNNASPASATYGWAFYDSSSTGNLTLYRRAGSTTGLKTLEVSRSNGYVTMPYQPAFFAHKGSDSIYGQSTQIAFDIIDFNRSSSYNSSTNLFTAPVAGAYSFSAHVQYTNGTTNQYVGASFWVNGTLYSQGYQGQYTTGAHTVVSLRLVLNMSAGDTVGVYTASFQNTPSPTTQASSTDKRTSFMGHLIG
jgi:hypothetical protein